MLGRFKIQYKHKEADKNQDEGLRTRDRATFYCPPLKLYNIGCFAFRAASLLSPAKSMNMPNSFKTLFYVKG